MSGEHLLSKLAIKNTSGDLEALLAFKSATKDQYDELTNPSGVLNLGVAVNKLQEEVILKKLNSVNQVVKEDLEYFDPTGTLPFREAIADIFNRHFNVHKQVESDQIMVVNGVTSGIDVITSVLCDPGDAILVSEPYYSMFVTDVSLRAQAEVHGVQVPLEEIQLPSQVTYYEQKLKELASKGIKTKMIIICNPHNPTGKCYSRKAIGALLRFANENQLFVLMDEIYALSVYRGKDVSSAGTVESSDDVLFPFESILSWSNLEEFIDPSLVVIVHGLSKDFCMNGFRIGWIVSPWNKNFMEAVSVTSVFSYQASLVNSMMAKVLGDREFIDGFINLVSTNLLDAYNKTTSYLKQNNIPYTPAQAGHFLWINIKEPLLTWKNNNLKPGEARLTSTDQLTFDDEYAMWLDTVNRGRIYITAGVNFKASEPGWARIIFAQPWDKLKVGLDRLLAFTTSSEPQS
ncbi:hypothetical protein BB559_003096 [Furculomyces boomerangus]|uniref:Aminotransferase class I/classII large domain-containing protein n=1 Tax=Furculomyces boomerangus TaxID=61424 RepID=A0A2T9YP83_9FUNG|nr:hypothetical protein BB559_003096 [Furculomyces boomerangus]